MEKLPSSVHVLGNYLKNPDVILAEEAIRKDTLQVGRDDQSRYLPNPCSSVGSGPMGRPLLLALVTNRDRTPRYKFCIL